MKKATIILAIVSSIILLAWLTGMLTLGSHFIVLSVAFFADYLTPHHSAMLSLDRAWSQWWQAGIVARWKLYMHDNALQQTTQDYAVLLGSGILFVLLLLVPWKSIKLKASTVHGSAHWATVREAQPFLKRIEKQAKRESQIPLGTYQGRQLVLREKTIEEHVLIVGPSGKGKTAGIIAPGILSERGNRSLVIIDPKQELVTLTAGAVSEFLDVWLFAPTEPEKSQRYNPLAHITSVEDAEDFANCWVSNTGRSSDPFWDRNTEQLIISAVLHLKAAEPDAPFSRLADILSGQSFEEIEQMLTHSPSQEARRTATAFLKNLKMNEKTAGGVMTDVSSRFFRFSQNPVLRTITASNDFTFADMVDPTRPAIAQYIAVPLEAATRLRPLTACFLMQMFTAFVHGTHEKGVTCYLDEFANAGTIPLMAEYCTTFRSRKVALIMAIQNHLQLDARYGKEDADTIKSNATTHIVLPGTGQLETEFYSRRIGETTVIGQSVSKNTAKKDATSNQSQQETGRSLIMPDEIRTMKKGEMLLLSDSVPPIKFKNTPYYKQRALVQRANLPFTLSSIQPLVQKQEALEIAQAERKENAMSTEIPTTNLLDDEREEAVFRITQPQEAKQMVIQPASQQRMTPD